MWPHLRRLWAGAGAVTAGLVVTWLYSLISEQALPRIHVVSALAYGYWPWFGGALFVLTIVSVFAEQAHRRHATLHFIGEEPGRKGATMPPLPASSTAASTLVVGREGELKQLRDWYVSMANGERHVVFVSGEAGVGKTTFVNTFVDSLRHEGIRIARGQCVEQYGVGEPYMPLLEALTQLGQGAESQQLLALLHRLAPAWLAQLPALLTAEERTRIQGETTQGLTQQRMLREMAQALVALTTDAPLVILIEDLHWSDASTLDLIAAIARGTEPARLLILGTYRPVEMLTGDNPLRVLKEELEVHQQCRELRLQLLSEADVAAYLNQRFANNSAQYISLAPAIYQRTDGNALFMVNMVNYMITQGSQFDASKIETSRNIRQMIERNLRRLDPEEQSVLESASVAGVEFSAAAVAAALERPVSEIELCCTRLSRNEQFISSLGESRWPDGTFTTAYGFLHALYQEVLYDGVPVGSRAEAHRRIAKREETAYGRHAGEIAAKLANHFSRANDHDKAVKYFQLASGRAAASRLDVLEQLLRKEDERQSPMPKKGDDQ